MGFSVFVELINIRIRSKGKPVQLKVGASRPGEPL